MKTRPTPHLNQKRIGLIRIEVVEVLRRFEHGQSIFELDLALLEFQPGGFWGIFRRSSDDEDRVVNLRVVFNLFDRDRPIVQRGAVSTFLTELHSIFVGERQSVHRAEIVEIFGQRVVALGVLI